MVLAVFAKPKSKKLTWQQGDIEGVWVGRASHAGPTVGLLGGVHGDERAGVEIVKAAHNHLKIDRGTVIVMMGNLPAIERGIRYIDTNLNRSFKTLDSSNNVKKLQYEAYRAQQLLPYLDKCESILDLHEYNDLKDKPFIICERDTLEIALRIGAPVISFGWSKTEAGGSDGYMHSQGKEGLVYELGPRTHTSQDVHLGVKVLLRFLAAKGMIDDKLPTLFRNPMLVQTHKAIKRADKHYKLTRHFTTFEKLVPGELIAVNGKDRIYAKPEQVIIFAEPNPPIGDEAFSIGRIVNN